MLPRIVRSPVEICFGTRPSLSAFGDNGGQLSTQEAWPLPYRHPTLQQEGAHLVDDAGALADQSLAHSVQGLQVELLGGLGGDELHGRALHRFGDRLGIAKVVLLSLRIRPHVFCRHQPSVATACLPLATEMMR